MNSLAKNIAQAINDFNSIRASIEEKGAAIGNMPTSTYAEKILSLSAEQYYYSPRGIMYTENMVMPDSVTDLFAYQYQGCEYLKSITLSAGITSLNAASVFSGCGNLETAVLPPNAVGTIAAQFFQSCVKLKSVEIPSGITAFTSNTFCYCYALEKIILPEGFKSMTTNVFKNCTSLTEVYLPGTVTSIGVSAFTGCTALEYVTLGQGFSASVNFSASDKFSADTIVAMFNSLADLTGDTAKTLTLGTVNLAKVTEEQKQIATNKNWNLA
ncbi:MAG: leucine-rich repeat domain-containing protein [Oscillospiraceae bacterium]